MEGIYFTVVPLNSNAERRLSFTPLADGEGVSLNIQGDFPVVIDRQQMFELGSLFLALSSSGPVDEDSASELLDGYGPEFAAGGSAVATKLAFALNPSLHLPD